MNEVWFSATGVSFGTKLLILFATVPGTGMLQSSDWLYRFDVQTRPYHVREHNPKNLCNPTKRPGRPTKRQ